jgi:hypothetical protein
MQCLAQIHVIVFNLTHFQNLSRFSHIVVWMELVKGVACYVCSNAKLRPVIVRYRQL